MRVVVNALSTTNLSGRHVLLGHLNQLAAHTQTQHEFVVLYHKDNHTIRCDLGPNVTFRKCHNITAHWLGRGAWEYGFLPRLLRELDADILLMASGTVIPHSPVPQVSLAMNPWCLVPGALHGFGNMLKGALQRHAYRKAVQRAALMVYLSEYLQEEYRKNAGKQADHCTVAYAGLGNDLDPTPPTPLALSDRIQNKIVSVSAMAPHKGVDTLLHALHFLREKEDGNVQLLLIGAWPSATYRAKIERMITDLDLVDQVQITGHLPRKKMLKHCANARVFCLMSRCESFGIPGLEAQALGTPVIAANCCALPEIYGPGAFCPEVDNARDTANVLHQLLTNDTTWNSLSDAARQNASRFSFSHTYRPFLKMFNLKGMS
jgi:glycosyltransferase involved in cell wall biosynthesis